MSWWAFHAAFGWLMPAVVVVLACAAVGRTLWPSMLAVLAISLAAVAAYGASRTALERDWEGHVGDVVNAIGFCAGEPAASEIARTGRYMSRCRFGRADPQSG